MKKLYTLLFSILLMFITTTTSEAQAPCVLTGAVVTVTYSAPPIMMHAAINSNSQHTFLWNDGTPVGSSSQKQFYSSWCVTITDIMTGCDTTICESCIPTGGVGPCTMIFMPVCGCDGVQYANDCVAMQNGIFTFTPAVSNGMPGGFLPCSTPSWDCTPGQGCSDPGTGLGAYTTLSACDSNCSITPTWECDVLLGCFDPGTGLGTYATFMDCDSLCSIVNPSWDCINGACVDPLTGQGSYANYNTCVTACVTPTWDCDPVTGCFDPGTGQGIYSTLSYCQLNCIVPSWDCVNYFCFDPGTGNGAYSDSNSCVTSCVVPSWDCIPGIPSQGCSDPGTGNGAYTTLAACNTACVTPSWDCNLLQGCFDPGTGQGVYSSLSACDSVCSATDVNEETLNFKIYPNPTKNTLTIDGVYTSVTIYNVFGKVVLMSDYQNIIDVAALRNGIYFIHIFTNNEIYVKKITITK